MKELIGYCGLDCELCDARIATLDNDDELRARTAKLWCEMNNTDVIKPEHINCTGCRVEGVKTYFCSCLCEVRKCCVEKGFETCAECSEKAVCEKLAPFRDNEVARKNMEEPILNSHNKAEFEPAHTAEHILNRTMVNMFGCPRSRNAHVERKKSKCDYLLAECPADDQVRAIEAKVNEVIAAALPVTIAYMSREEAVSVVDLSKLPEGASDILRIVRIGDYDDCACIGAHVSNTSEIGQFRIISHDFNDGVWRVRWKVVK